MWPCADHVGARPRSEQQLYIDYPGAHQQHDAGAEHLLDPHEHHSHQHLADLYDADGNFNDTDQHLCHADVPAGGTAGAEL